MSLFGVNFGPAPTAMDIEGNNVRSTPLTCNAIYIQQQPTPMPSSMTSSMEGYETVQLKKPIRDPQTNNTRFYPAYPQFNPSDDVRIDMGVQFGSMC